MNEISRRIAMEAGIMAVDRHDSYCLIRQRDTLRFLEACRAEEIVVLGIEGFLENGPNIIPDMNLIADFSEISAKNWTERSCRSIEEAVGFVSAKADMPLILFDFCLTQRETI